MTTRFLAPGGAALSGLLAVWWVAAPASHPLTDHPLLIMRLLTEAAAASTLLGSSVAALGLSLLATRFHRLVPLATGVGLVYALLLTLGYQSAGMIALAGYAVALAIPVGLLVLLVQTVRRYRSLRVVVLLLVAGAIAWAGILGLFGDRRVPQVFGDILGKFGPTLLAQLVPAALLGTAAAFVASGWKRIGPSETGARVAAFVREHRTVFTLVAAACPLPYVLVRLTWLTPWPVLAPGEIGPEWHLWGLLLGGAALLGSVLTIGLIRPWGEVFPRWMPVLAGARVPRAAATIPGFTVAAVLGTAGISVLFRHAPGTGPGLAHSLATAMIFPFWLWAPSLALAVAGYLGHRRVAG